MHMSSSVSSTRLQRCMRLNDEKFDRPWNGNDGVRAGRVACQAQACMLDASRSACSGPAVQGRMKCNSTPIAHNVQGTATSRAGQHARSMNTSSVQAAQQNFSPHAFALARSFGYARNTASAALPFATSAVVQVTLMHDASDH